MFAKQIQAAHAKIERYLPENWSAEIVATAPDLCNHTPTDLTIARDGSLIANEQLATDVYPGAPSPGLWLLFPISQILGFMIILQSVQLFVQHTEFTVFAPFASLSATVAAASGLKVLSALGLLLTSVVFLERENSLGAITTLKIGTVVVIAISFFPVLIPILLWLWLRRIFQLKIIMSIIAALFCLALMPLLVPALFFAAGVITLFAHRILISGYITARENRIRYVALDSSSTAFRKDLNISEDIRQKQANRAAKDLTTFLELGTSKGFLRADGDHLTPDKGAVIGLTVKDISSNLFVTGSPGKGKTVLFKGLAWQWITADAGGFLAMDGKGALHIDLANLLDKVVDPFRCRINPLLNADPEPAAAVMLKICSDANKKDFFDKTTEAMLRQALFLIRDLNARGIQDFSYSLRGLYEFNSDEPRRNEILNRVSLEENAPLEIVESYKYWRVSYPALDSRLKDSQFATFNSWLNSVVLNSKLATWSGVESDIDIVDAVMRGRKIGIAAPEQECGVGGTLVLALVKSSLFSAIGKRAQDPDYAVRANGKPVLLLVDECKKITTPGIDDLAASQGRSLGLKMVYSTQNLEQLSSELGGESHLKSLIGVFGSRVTLLSNCELTHKLACEHAGTRHRFINDDQKTEGSNFNLAARAAASQNQDKGGLAEWLSGVTDSFSFRRKQASSAVSISEHDSDTRKRESIAGVWKLESTVTPTELTMYLQEPQTALIAVERAGAIRREICDLTIPLDHECLQPPSESQLKALELKIENHYRPGRYEQPYATISLAEADIAAREILSRISAGEQACAVIQEYCGQLDFI